MIEKVTFKNFKALRDVTLDLSPFTLIVGPNASGKTSILEALHCLTQVSGNSPDSVFQGERNVNVVRSCGSDEPVALTMAGTWDGTSGKIEYVSAPAKDGRATTTEVTVDKQSYKLHVRSGKAPVPPEAVQKLLLRAGSAILLRLDPSRLAAPSYSMESTPHIEFDGGNLGATLADLALSSPSGLQDLLSRVRSVVRIVDSLSLNRVPISKTEYVPSKNQAGLFEQSHATYQGYGVRLVLSGGGLVPAHAVSEGTLITLGLLTALCREPVPRLVMIDEFERGLHPKALGGLVHQIRLLMQRYPNLQVIGTTHSPYLVDHFKPEEVRLTTLRDDGSVVAGTLNEHPDFERWKDEMKPGEFWSSVGEDWLREKKEPSGG